MKSTALIRHSYAALRPPLPAEEQLYSHVGTYYLTCIAILGPRHAPVCGVGGKRIVNRIVHG